jgi:hypothetical protein
MNDEYGEKRYKLGFYYRGTKCQLDTDYGVEPYHDYGNYHCVSIEFDSLQEARKILDKILNDACLMPVDGYPFLMDNRNGMYIKEMLK